MQAVDIISVDIPKEAFNRYVEDSITLNTLQRHGVDNWDYYDEAMAEARENIATYYKMSGQNETD